MHKFIMNKTELSFCLSYFYCYDFFFLQGRPVSGVVRKFKCLLKKTQSFCPCSRFLNRSGKGLIVQLPVSVGLRRGESLVERADIPSGINLAESQVK
jgi:hypothetical protein